MHALILAAGYGTRLGATTLNTPKPMLEVAGKPMITYLLEAIERVPEVRRTTVVTNGKFYPNFCGWMNEVPHAKTLEVVSDGTHTNEERLGAIGDICLTAEQQSIDDDLLIVGGDNLFQFDLREFARFALARGSSVGVYRLCSLEMASKYGNVEVDENGRVRWFEEKPTKPRSPLIATCLYLIRRQDLPMLGRYRETQAKMDAPGLFIAWLSQQTDVYGFECKGLWFDIGDPKSLEDARSAFTTERRP